VNIVKVIAIKRLKELSVEDLEELEDYFLGGETEI